MNSVQKFCVAGLIATPFIAVLAMLNLGAHEVGDSEGSSPLGAFRPRVARIRIGLPGHSEPHRSFLPNRGFRELLGLS